MTIRMNVTGHGGCMTKQTISAIDRLAALLDDEAEGRPFNPMDVRDLARDVSVIIPEIWPFMRPVMARMTQRQT